MTTRFANLMRVMVLVAFACLPAIGVNAQQDVQNCGSIANGYGPFDYTNPVHRRDKLPIVESRHYDADIIALRGYEGMSWQLAGDLDYTLRAFPNHHRALYTMIQYHFSDDPRHDKPLEKSVDCYFIRAKRMKPDDSKVSLIYGIYKARTGDFEGAQKLFLEAEQATPNSSEVLYNIGLMYAKQKRYDEARGYAQRAYALGYPLPGLRNMLKRADKWQE